MAVESAGTKRELLPMVAATLDSHESNGLDFLYHRESLVLKLLWYLWLQLGMMGLESRRDFGRGGLVCGTLHVL